MARLDIYVSSQTGCVRDHNEDIVLAGHGLFQDEDWQSRNIRLSSKDRYIASVCDGMGGHNAGEVASQDVAEQLSQFFSELPDNLSCEELVSRFRTWQKEEHDYLAQCGLDNPDQIGMGTTMVGWFYYQEHVFWFNCGDSRLYRFRDDSLCQISCDHSLFSVTHRMQDAHVITNCMGGGAPDVFLDIEELTDDLHDGDVFILCSDGLSDMLEDEEIEQVLMDGGRASALTMAACEAGGMDNVSTCVIEYYNK